MAIGVPRAPPISLALRPPPELPALQHGVWHIPCLRESCSALRHRCGPRREDMRTMTVIVLLVVGFVVLAGVIAKILATAGTNERS